ncbi:unnamed protein product [Rotaria sordida]|uniref:Uncharacterized protein n=1 Tax=Rotaria sordida TaxID=392033 RepID=A0A814HV75_9BILA|nr:unnamed protein product [Rotaria sordida]
MKCYHQYQTLNYLNIQYRNEKNSNAILSSIDIWKDDIKKNNYLKQNYSPLYNIPLCFHNNFSLNNKQNFNNEKSLETIKKILSSHRSYESLLHRLPSPPKPRLSQTSLTDSNIIEPITLIDDKLMNKEMLIEKLSSSHHQSNEKSVLIDNKLIKSKSKYDLSSQIIINQFIKDINTNIETSINSISKSLIKKKINYKSQRKYSYNKYKLKTSHSIILHNKNHLKYSLFPTVPKCFNEYFQINFNSLLDKKISNKYFQLNIFDSNLFQWEIFNLNQYENFFCRKNSLLLFNNNNNKSPIQTFIYYIQSQRQYVPSKYSSWNIFFPNYHPLKFSLKNSKLNFNFNIKNPYGRTGLIGQSLLENFGPNRYIISLIIIEENNKKYILLIKNQYEKWELPKTKNLKKNLHYHTLDIVYLDHPLNTDNTWIEIQIILIKNSYKYFHKKTWFLINYLHKLNNIEHFDFNLIQFYI